MKFFSFEKSSKKERPNPLKSEHLREGVSPIIACIGTPEQFKKELRGYLEEPQYEIIPDPSLDTNNNRNVDYYEDPHKLSRQNFKNGGRYSYVISSIDSSNKFSESYKNCSGLIITGLDKETGQNISFLSHQDPNYFLRPEKDTTGSFAEDLKIQINELKERCEDGTIDAVIVGGNYFHEKDDKRWREDYINSIKLLSKEVRDTLGFEPVIMTGPKTVRGRDDVFYDNDHRRLYIMRPEVGKESTKSYVQSDIKDLEKKW